MKRKEDLFELIKAMSRGEKRYFTVNAGKSGRSGSKYLELYQAISAMTDYDESRLKARFGAGLADDKAYLYEVILRSMRDYRSAKSHYAQVKDKIMDARYLYQLGLYNQCEERLQEALELAAALHDRLAMLEINAELRILRKAQKSKTFSAELQALIEAAPKLFQDIQEEWHYLDRLDTLLVSLNRFQTVTSERGREQLQEQFLPLYDLAHAPEAFRARLRFFQGRALFFFQMGDSPKSYESMKEVVRLWEQEDVFRKEEFYRFVMDYSDYLVAHARIHGYKSLAPLLEKLQRQQPSSVHEAAILFRKTIVLKLLYCLNTGTINTLDSIRKEVDAGLREFEIPHGTQMVILNNLAILCLMAGRNKLAGQYCDAIIRSYNQPDRQDQRPVAYLLKALALFDMEDPDLDNALRATSRTLEKAFDVYDASFEQQTLAYLRRLNSVPPGEVRSVFIEFRDFVKNARSNPDLRVASDMDELISFWIDSKLEKKSLADVIRSQAH